MLRSPPELRGGSFGRRQSNLPFLFPLAMPDVDVLKAAQIYFTGLPLAFAAAIFFAPKEFMAA